MMAKQLKRLNANVLMLRISIVYLGVSYAALWYKMSKKHEKLPAQTLVVNDTEHIALNFANRQVPMTTPVICAHNEINAVFMLALSKDNRYWQIALSRLRHVIFFWQGRGKQATIILFTDQHSSFLQNECAQDKYCHFVMNSELHTFSDGKLKQLAAKSIFNKTDCVGIFRDIIILRSPIGQEQAAVLDYNVVDRASIAVVGHGTCLENNVNYESRQRCLLYILRYKQETTVVSYKQ